MYLKVNTYLNKINIKRNYFVCYILYNDIFLLFNCLFD